MVMKVPYLSAFEHFSYCHVGTMLDELVRSKPSKLAFELRRYVAEVHLEWLWRRQIVHVLQFPAGQKIFDKELQLINFEALSGDLVLDFLKLNLHAAELERAQKGRHPGRQRERHKPKGDRIEAVVHLLVLEAQTQMDTQQSAGHRQNYPA
jgi:hypothetical protein